MDLRITIETECHLCNGKGEVESGPSCLKPASQCCGGCYDTYTCNLCGGRGSILVQFEVESLKKSDIFILFPDTFFTTPVLPIIHEELESCLGKEVYDQNDGNFVIYQFKHKEFETVKDIVDSYEGRIFQFNQIQWKCI